MEKKYEMLFEDTIKVDNHTLYRIRAVRDLPLINVKKGDLGGYVEKMYSLSHLGYCWVFDNACVYGEAQVKGRSLIKGNTTICNKADVEDCFVEGEDTPITISGGNLYSSSIYGASIFDSEVKHSRIFNNAKVIDTIISFSEVKEESKVDTCYLWSSTINPNSSITKRCLKRETVAEGTVMVMDN